MFKGVCRNTCSTFISLLLYACKLVFIRKCPRSVCIRAQFTYIPSLLSRVLTRISYDNLVLRRRPYIRPRHFSVNGLKLTCFIPTSTLGVNSIARSCEVKFEVLVNTPTLLARLGRYGRLRAGVVR